ncbi:MAG: glycosyltransferase family 8 protein [Pirellulaceae bacterium]|nr:glycosyltransferase family 8 protein [Pirellulaceae bacterium]
MNADEICLVSAADDNYAMPLAATIRSAIDSLPRRCRLRLFILDGGMTPASQEKVRASWRDPRVQVNWLRPDLDAISDLPTCGYLALTTYLRLFIAELLPTDVSHAIYLDSDVIIRRNLQLLWRERSDGFALRAVPDYLTPFLNTRESLGRPTMCDSPPTNSLPVVNYRELGLPGHRPYFNAGVLVINLDHWRRTSFLHSALRCLRDHRDQVRWGDQYALNVLLSGQWQPLDPRWNQLGTIYDCASPHEFALDNHRQALNDPWIIHYCWRNKPWAENSNHPLAKHFFRALDRTAWRGWRVLRPQRVRQPTILDPYVQKYQRKLSRFYTKRVSPLMQAIFGKAA